MKYIKTNYFKWISESNEEDISKIIPKSKEEIELARRKVEKCILWLNINMGFYAELLSHIFVYGTYGKPTMFTNCKNYIGYNPTFVIHQSNEAVRFVFMHEILHVIAHHNERIGSRNHDLWNEACDLAINPIIKSESRFGKSILFPTENGKFIGLYEERFDGMRAEDIYDIMISEGRKPPVNNPGNDIGNDSVTPVEGSVVQGELEEEYVNPDDEIQDEKEDEKETPEFNKETEEGGISKGGSSKSREEEKTSAERDESGNLLKGDAKKQKLYGTSKILRRKTPNWESVTQSALSRGTLSEKTKKILSGALGEVPLVNWASELTKWFDHCLYSTETIIPNRRLLGSGLITYGTKKSGTSGLKTIVAAIDTSGSISDDQKKTFLNEVAFLAKKHNSDRLIIIYCSDDIDGVQIVKKGQPIDISVMKSTGGNSNGFIPPFKWCSDNNIKPSVFVYLTDTGGLMPDKETFGIRRYMNKVIWFICSLSIYNPPPFGKSIFMPVASIKKDGNHKTEKL